MNWKPFCAGLRDLRVFYLGITYSLHVCHFEISMKDCNITVSNPEDLMLPRICHKIEIMEQ